MFSNNQVKLLLILKLNQLKREELSTLTYEILLDYLFHVVWKESVPENLNDIASDILAISSKDIVSYLSLKAIVDGKKNKLSDYSDLY